MAIKKKVTISLEFTEKKHTELITKLKQIQTHFNNFIKNPPLAVEAAATTVKYAAYGAVLRYVFDTFAIRLRSPPLKAAFESRVMNARNFAVLTGVDAGISCVMKKVRGKEDIHTSLVAGFVSGVMFAIVRHQPPAVVVLNGVFFAIAGAGTFKVLEKSKSSK